MYPDGAPSTPMATALPSRGNGVPLEVGRLLRDLGRRKRILALGALAGLALGAIASRFAHPTYRAGTVLVWDDPTIVDATTIERRLRTAVDEIKLPGTLQQTRAKLKLGLTLEELGARIDAATAAGSDLLQITATGPTGADAATLADEVAIAFLAHRTDQVRSLARDHANELDGQIHAATKALGVARVARDRFRAEHGLVDLPSERTLAIEQRAVLASDAERARADAGVEIARATDLHDAAILLPSVSVLSETESRPDVRRLAEAENELAMMRGYLTDDSPRLKAKAGEVANLRERAKRADLVVRAERIVGRNPLHDFIKQNQADAAARAVAAERRYDAYRELADKARSRIDELNKLEGEAAELDSRVTALDGRIAALRRDLQAALERADVGGADLHVIAGASVPPRPFKSKRKFIAIAVAAATFFVVLLALVILALRGLRLVTPRELAYWSGFPVVAACERLCDESEIDALARELAPIGSGPGRTLLIAATAHERDTARSLATRFETAGVSEQESVVQLWAEPSDGRLRRRARAVARVLVIVGSRHHPPWELRQLAARIGRTTNVGIVAVDVGTELAHVVDQAGDPSTVLPRSMP